MFDAQRIAEPLHGSGAAKKKAEIRQRRANRHKNK